jgi:hypothetical protein
MLVCSLCIGNQDLAWTAKLCADWMALRFFEHGAVDAHAMSTAAGSFSVFAGHAEILARQVGTK